VTDLYLSRTENWEMYMVRPLVQKKKPRTELPLEKKVELIRDFRVSPNTKQKHFAIKYGWRTVSLNNGISICLKCNEHCPIDS